MRSIPCPLRENARNSGQYPAVISGKILFTYQELDNAVELSVARLEGIGVKKGDRICIVSFANIEYIILMFALWRIGAIACLLNEKLPQLTLNEQCRKVRAKFILSGNSAVLNSNHIKAKKIDLSCVVELPACRQTILQKKRIFYSEDQASTVIFSSGSSARPKAVQQSIGNHYYNAKGSNENIPVCPGNRWLISLPLYHVSGLSIVFRCMLGAGAVVIPDKNNDVIGSIDKFRVTHVSLVAAQLYQFLLVKKARSALKKLKAILLGGSAIPETLLKNAVKLGLPVYVSYGLTEMSSQVATTGMLKANNYFMKAKVLRYRKVRIAQDGEILLSGKTLFQGYINNGKLVKAVDKRGWFHSRDIGFFKEGRYLFVRGRKDNMFISGGENIYPEEIEHLLCKLEFIPTFKNRGSKAADEVGISPQRGRATGGSIEQAVVVPIVSEEYGARPVAFLKPKGHKHIKLPLVLEFLTRYLPKFKIPDEFYLWPKEGLSKGIKLQRNDFLRLVETGRQKLIKL